jgi:hypothetical protein
MLVRERTSARDKQEEREREREKGRDFEGQGCDVRDEYRRDDDTDRCSRQTDGQTDAGAGAT